MKKFFSAILGVVVIPALFILIQSPSIYWKYYCIFLGIAIAALIIVEAPGIAKLFRRPTFLLESMPSQVFPLRGREVYLMQINSFIKNNAQRIMIIEGESGLGKTSIISSYINKTKTQFDVIIWQPLVDLPTMKEVVNGWLNIYTENIPDVGFNARLDAFLRNANINKHKEILIVFDNCESIIQAKGNQISLPEEFISLVSRLITYQDCKIKVVITSAVDLKNLFPFQVEPVIISVSKLDTEILSKIVYDRTTLTMDETSLVTAHGNPSAALLTAEIIKKGESLLGEMNQAKSYATLVDKRMQLLNDQQRRLVELLSILKYPMSISEIQELWKLLPPYSLVSQLEIADLQHTFLLEKSSENKYLINPIVASVVETQVVESLSKTIISQDIEESSLINKLPLDYAQWPKKARINVSKNIFPAIVENLRILYQCDVYKFGSTDVMDILQKVKFVKPGFLSSNIVTFFLFCGINFNNVIFPPAYLIGIDFSQVHLFNTDLSNVNIVNCQFADRIGSAHTVRFMGDNYLIVGLASGSIELRKTVDLSRITRTEAHSEPVRAVCYSEKYKKIISGGEDGRVVIYDERLNQLKSIELNCQWIWQIINLSDEYVLVVACGGSLGVIDLATNNACGIFPVPSLRVWKATICENDLFLASEDGVLWKCRLSDILSLQKPKWVIAANIQQPIKACCACAGKVVFGCRDGKLFLTDKTGEYKLLANEDSCIRDICSIEGSNKIITVGDYGVAHIYDAEVEKLLGEFQAQSSRTWALDTLSSGIAVTVGDDRTIHLWDVNEYTSLKISCGNGQSLRDVDIYLSDYIFACADDFLRVQRIENQHQIFPWKMLRKRKRILGFVSLDGGRWACSFEDGAVLLGDSEKILHEISAHNSAIESIARNSDGTMFATGGEDRTIRIYNCDGTLHISPKPLHNSRIWSLAFSPDKSKLASAGGDFIVAIWDVKSGDVLGSCLGHNNLVLSLCWLNNNNIVSAGTDGTIRLWDVSTTSCLKIKVIPCIVRGVCSDGCGAIYGVGRNKTADPGWIIIKWNIQNDDIIIKQIDVVGGSARSVLATNGKVYLGGDMPLWIEIDPVTLDVVNQFRIPGIYNEMKIDANKSEGIDFDCLTLLGANILGR